MDANDLKEAMLSALRRQVDLSNRLHHFEETGVFIPGATHACEKGHSLPDAKVPCLICALQNKP